MTLRYIIGELVFTNQAGKALLLIYINVFYSTGDIQWFLGEASLYYVRSFIQSDPCSASLGLAQ